MSLVFPSFRQLESADCGLTCLRMIARYHGKSIDLVSLKKRYPIDRNGMTLKALSQAAEGLGLRSHGAKLAFQGDRQEAGLEDIPLPAIAYWDQKHYVVIYKISKKTVWVADPAIGKLKYNHQDFKDHWLTDGNKGIILLLEPGPDFTQENIETKEKSFFSFFQYLQPFKRLVLQLFLGLIVGSFFSLILPFLTQLIVDQGIVNQDLNLINIILIAQVVLFVSTTFINALQSWIFLHIGVRISVQLIYDFLLKLMNLPMRFFSRTSVSDLLQRINDHSRLNAFITSSTVSFVFSIFNLILFSIVLFIYSVQLFGIYWISSIGYIIWILLFQQKRRILDFETFELDVANRSKLIEIIEGIQEIKLQNSQWKRRWQWSNLQAKIFKLRIRTLRLTQLQSIGAGSINQFRNIIISFLAAVAVIQGEMTLGTMMAIQYIIGQINAPLSSMIDFIHSAQSAKIGFERLNEIHAEENESEEYGTLTNIPKSGDLLIEDLSFRYSEASEEILHDINLVIPRNQVTAIVGESGSGKTTFLKLLLGFYQPSKGKISIGDTKLSDFQLESWRGRCGAVMQDGYIFPDTIAHNIAESDHEVNVDKLYAAARTSNVDKFLPKLHAGYNTAIGEYGVDLSQGQKQRILIARAVYKNPEFMFFDEATNALDANNELEIMRNLEEFYIGRTVIVVAHRLSSVKKADKIIVLKHGRISEEGNHESLVSAKGDYYHLVKNQLELGS